MKRFCCQLMLSTVLGVASILGHDARSGLLAQTVSDEASQETTCTPPALSRLTHHKVTSGETLAAIAQKYNLIPATLMGLNPVLQSGQAPVGAEILVPPYNGIRVELQPKQTWREVAKTYNIRPDVLFEVNGCQAAPKAVFVPGVNWSPVAPTRTTSATATKPTPDPVKRLLKGSPLVAPLTRSLVLLTYGWGIQPNTGKVGFHSGIDVAAAPGASVLAVADGTVAFAGKQGAYGNLVVINHAEGLQTRYAQLATIKAKVGQTVKRGQTIATVGTSGKPSSQAPHLHFEVRSRSKLGWVAENPDLYLFNSPQPTQAQK